MSGDCRLMFDTQVCCEGLPGIAGSDVKEYPGSKGLFTNYVVRMGGSVKILFMIIGGG